MSTEDVLRERYPRVLERLDAACAAAGRGREDVALIAVSKLHPAADVAAVARAGAYSASVFCAWTSRVTAK